MANNIMAERLKALRKEHNLTQKELAEKINMNHSTISNIEKGKTNSTYKTINKLSNYFNVSINYLLGRSNWKQLIDSKKENEIEPVVLSDQPLVALEELFDNIDKLNKNKDTELSLFKNLSKKFLKRKKEYNLSYADLTRLTGIPMSTLRHYATNSINTIPLSKLITLCKLLNINPIDEIREELKDEADIKLSNGEVIKAGQIENKIVLLQNKKNDWKPFNFDDDMLKKIDKLMAVNETLLSDLNVSLNDKYKLKKLIISFFAKTA